MMLARYLVEMDERNSANAQRTVVLSHVYMLDGGINLRLYCSLKNTARI